MFSRIEQLKRTGSWETIPIWRRSHETFKALTSLPSTNFKESKKILLSLLYLFLYFSFDEWNSNLWNFVGLCSSSLVLHFTFYCILGFHHRYFAASLSGGQPKMYWRLCCTGVKKSHEIAHLLPNTRSIHTVKSFSPMTVHRFGVDPQWNYDVAWNPRISVIQIHWAIKTVHFECELFLFQLHRNMIFVLHCIYIELHNIKINRTLVYCIPSYVLHAIPLLPLLSVSSSKLSSELHCEINILNLNTKYKQIFLKRYKKLVKDLNPKFPAKFLSGTYCWLSTAQKPFKMLYFCTRTAQKHLPYNKTL